MEQPIDWPQHGRHRTQALVVHLAENQVEELPERGILGHAFVTVDEVVATAEGDLEHFAVGDANVGIGDNILGANRLFRHRPVANWIALDFEALLLFLYKKELQAVGTCCSHCRKASSPSMDSSSRCG